MKEILHKGMTEEWQNAIFTRLTVGQGFHMLVKKLVFMQSDGHAVVAHSNRVDEAHPWQLQLVSAARRAIHLATAAAVVLYKAKAVH